MAGVKGRSGGARPGAGRKPKSSVLAVKAGPDEKAESKPGPMAMPAGVDMLTMLQKVALGEVEATPLQVRAAIAAVQYTHTKRHDGGKREEAAEKAGKAAGGRFGAAAAPRLVASGGKKV